MGFMDIIPATPPKRLTSETNFSSDLLIIDAYSKIPKLYGMEIITTEEVMDKLDMFQARYGKTYRFGRWGLEIISADAGTQFTSMEFQDKCQNYGVHLTLASLEHQETNGQVKVTWRMLHMTTHLLMVHARVLEGYIHFTLMYTLYNILPLLTIRDLIKKDGDLNTPFKLATGRKPSISHLRVLFCPCVV